MTGKIVYTKKGKKYLIDGRCVTEKVFRRRFPQVKAGESADGLIVFRPLHSEAAAVHPAQIEEAAESARSKGVPTEFDQHGCPIFTSRGHRRNYLKAYGFIDRNGGYGDG